MRYISLLVIVSFFRMAAQDCWCAPCMQPLLFGSLAKYVQEYAEHCLQEPKQGLNAIATMVGRSAMEKRDKNALTKMLRSLNASASMERHFTKYGAMQYTAKITSLLDTFAATNQAASPTVSAALHIDICDSDTDVSEVPAGATPGPDVNDLDRDASLDVVQKLQSRVELLERVFVLVDWESLPPPLPVGPVGHPHSHGVADTSVVSECASVASTPICHGSSGVAHRSIAKSCQTEETSLQQRPLSRVDTVCAAARLLHFADCPLHTGQCDCVERCYQCLIGKGSLTSPT